MKNILLLTAIVLLFSNCSDRMYAFRDKVRVDRTPATASAPKDEKVAPSKEEAALTSPAKSPAMEVSAQATAPVIVTGPSATLGQEKTTVPAVKTFKARKAMKAARVQKMLIKNQDVSASPSHTDASPRSLIILGLILLLVGILLFWVPLIGWLLFTIGFILLIIGLILYLVGAL